MMMMTSMNPNKMMKPLASKQKGARVTKTLQKTLKNVSTPPKPRSSDSIKLSSEASKGGKSDSNIGALKEGLADWGSSSTATETAPSKPTSSDWDYNKMMEGVDRFMETFFESMQRGRHLMPGGNPLKFMENSPR